MPDTSIVPPSKITPLQLLWLDLSEMEFVKMTGFPLAPVEKVAPEL